jgi:hypothetical protein
VKQPRRKSWTSLPVQKHSASRPRLEAHFACSCRAMQSPGSMGSQQVKAHKGCGLPAASLGGNKAARYYFSPRAK